MFGFFVVVCSVGSGLVQRILTGDVCLNLSDLGTSTTRRPGPELGCCTTDKKNIQKCRGQIPVLQRHELTCKLTERNVN